MFRWNDDDSVLLYQNWEAGGSDDTDLPLMDTCVALHSSTGKWENISCSDEPENGVVCQTSMIIIIFHYNLIFTNIFFCISFNAVFSKLLVAASRQNQ